MVLETYISRESPKFEGKNAVESMIKDYTHYRDIAIRFGEDVSKLPRRLNLIFTKK